uniref:Uncharacterized protein n=1 Tax=viral metagenome TaxID=1070528 RepID=A0A6C0HBW0_9ZZZZ
MTKTDSLITAFTTHFHTIMTLVFGLIVLYIVMYPHYLSFYFENTLGRASLILFIIAMTYCNPLLGAITTVVFIGLYNSRVIEGMESKDKVDIIAPSKPSNPKTTEASTSTKPAPLLAASSDEKKPAPPLDKSSEPAVVPKENVQKKGDKVDKKEGFHNMTLSPADLSEGRNRMLTIEDYIRKPKSSNQMSFSKYNESSFEPMANYSGPEGLKSVSSVAK